MIRPETEVSVTGTAEQDYLKSGVNVEFVAEVNKNAHGQGKDLSSCSSSRPPPNGRPAFYATDLATPSKSEKGEKGTCDGVKPLPHDPGISSAPPARRSKAGGRQRSPICSAPIHWPASLPKHRAAPPMHPGTFTVRGREDQDVQGWQDHRLRRPRPNDQSRVSQRCHDQRRNVRYPNAQPDDRVTVEALPQAQPDLVMAKSVTIELANPLSGAKEPGARGTKAPAAPARQGEERGGRRGCRARYRTIKGCLKTWEARHKVWSTDIVWQGWPAKPHHKSRGNGGPSLCSTAPITAWFQSFSHY